MMPCRKLQLEYLTDCIPSKLSNLIESELTEKEIVEIDIRVWGNIILGMAKNLSSRVNKELLEPISVWLNDPGWIECFKTSDSGVPDWVFYKRKQRHWTKQQRQLAAERLKLYMQEIRKKNKLKKEIRQIIGQSNPKGSTEITIQDCFIENIVSPFSPPERRREDILRQFQTSLSLSISDLLPWKLIIIEELSANGKCKRLSDFKAYYPENKKRDIVSKLMHLLELEKYGEVELIQEGPFEEIFIHQSNSEVAEVITVTDQTGNDYEFVWFDLNDNQKRKIIDDIKTHKILCKQSMIQ